MTPVDPRTLEIFRAIAETGSATRAANRLNTTQPSVTRTIGAFEKSCGFRLFDRGRNGMTLTPEGEVLLASVERSFAGLRAVQRTIGEIRGGLHGTLWATAIPVVAEGVLGALLGRFARENPQVSVNQHVAPPELVLNRILAGEVDMGAIIGPVPIGMKLAAVPIGERTMTLVVAPHHRLADRDLVRFSELDGEIFVMMPRAHNIRSTVDAMLEEFGVRPGMIHEMGSQRSVAEVVRNCDGIGFIDTEIVDSMRPGSLVAVPLDPPASWTINLIHRRDDRSKVLAAFLDWLAGQVDQPAANPVSAGP